MKSMNNTLTMIVSDIKIELSTKDKNADVFIQTITFVKKQSSLNKCSIESLDCKHTECYDENTLLWESDCIPNCGECEFNEKCVSGQCSKKY